MERNQKVAISKDIFRVIVGQKKKDKFQRYCPSIEGALPAFKHSANNLRKLLLAGFQIYWEMKYQNKNFTEEPFRQQFPNNTEISANRWRHAYKALRETIRSYNLESDTNWTAHLPFLLSYVGAYQGWVEPSLAMAEEFFSDGREDQKHRKFVQDLYDLTKMRERPIIPAANMRRNLNGLNTPSVSDGVGVVQSIERSLNNRQPWTAQEKRDANLSPTSLRPAPIFGELNNLSPPMYIDHDPNILAAYEAVIFIQVETRQVEQLLRNKDARGTRYDPRNDPAWHRRSDLAEFQVMNMVKYTEAVQFSVKSIDALELTDKTGVPINQEYLDLMLDYLNGNKFIPGTDLSARNTHGSKEWFYLSKICFSKKSNTILKITDFCKKSKKNHVKGSIPKTDHP